MRTCKSEVGIKHRSIFACVRECLCVNRAGEQANQGFPDNSCRSSVTTDSTCTRLKRQTWPLVCKKMETQRNKKEEGKRAAICAFYYSVL